MNSVCIDAGSTAGTSQDGPHVYGGYVEVGNPVNPNRTVGYINTQSCTGIWAAGPLRYFGGLLDVGALSNNNCLGVWSTGGASEIIGKFEQHGNYESSTFGTGVYINPASARSITVSSSTVYSVARDSTGSFVTVKFVTGVANPFSQGQLVEVSGLLPAETVPGQSTSVCTFNTVNGDDGKTVVATTGTDGSGHAYFTYAQNCAADANGTVSPSSGTIEGFAVANDLVDGLMLGFYQPVVIGTGATNNTVHISPSGTTNTAVTVGTSQIPKDIFDSGIGTVFTANGSSPGQVVSQVSGDPQVDLFDLCISTTPPTCSTPVFKVDSTGNAWIGAGSGSSSTLNVNGSTSGTATIQSQAAAGTPILTLPTTSGTFAVSATAPLALNSTTGVVSCGSCLTTIPTLDQIGNLASAKTFADGNFPLAFNSATTTGSQTAISFGETTAAQGAGDIEVGISTSNGSTSVPLSISQGSGLAGSSAPNVEIVTAGTGGAASPSTTGPGNTGGGWSLTGGNGSTGGSSSGNGGTGGAWMLTTGNGGSATGSSNTGGSGGAFNVTTGNGANGGSGSTSGNGGNVVFNMGVGGTTGTPGSTGQFEVAGTAPASQSSAGISVGTIFNVAGVTGGGSSGSATTAGTGSVVSINSGAGGAGSGTNAVGGAGGAINITAGGGGVSNGSASNAPGGNIVLTPGVAGTGGSGIAGNPGQVQMAFGTVGGSSTSKFLNITGTWNTTGNVDAGIYENVTNTASGSNSLLMDLRASNTQEFSVGVGGAATASGPVSTGTDFSMTEGSAPSGTSGADVIYGDSTAHLPRWNANNMGFQNLPQTNVLSSAYTSSSSTFTNVTGMSWSVLPNTNYTMTCTLLYKGNGSTANSPKFQITGPSTPTAVALGIDGYNGTSYVEGVAIGFSSSLDPFGTMANVGTVYLAHINLGVANGLNGGTIALQASNSVGTDTITILAGSFCTFQ